MLLIIQNESIQFIDPFFEDIYNMKKYMEGEFDIVLIDGEHKKTNATYNIIWRMDSDSMIMKATLLNNNLPENISYLYEANGIKNIMKQKHRSISNNQTLIINTQEFEFYGIMKILTFLKFKGFKIEDFKNQSQIYLKNFKSYIENEANKNRPINS